jgi:Cu2+-exporting ATPase
LLADRCAGWFVAVLLAVATGTAGLWWLIEPGRALAITVAVLVVSCPCALSLATPAALSAATAALARRGVLVFRGHALETLARATHVVFDKTGTLTEGNLVLVRTVLMGELSQQQCLSIAAALEREVQHPAGQALARAAMAEYSSAAINCEYVAGQGVRGMIDGRTYRVGRPEFVSALHGKIWPADSVDVEAAASIVALGDERGWLAWFGLIDALRPQAVALMGELRQLGVAVSVHSGDREQAVRHVADALGLPEWRAAMTPEDKRDAVRALQDAGAVVVMIGDGANDGPALAQAQASMALATGAAIAQSGADVVLVGHDLAPVALALRSARRTFAIIRQNLAWAVLYNLVCVPLAAAGWITPLLAGIGMSLSSLLVVANALRLTRAGGDPQSNRH